MRGSTTRDFPSPTRQSKFSAPNKNLGHLMPNISSHTPENMTSSARSYWEGVNADIDGMLGGIPSIAGFSQVSKVDLQGSRSFLAKLGIGKKNGRRTVENALEGGAG